jgi:hypothetical protein
MQFTRIAALVALLTGGVAACSRNYERAEFATEPPPRSVTIQNDNWLDVVVYLVRGGVRQRLSVVPGLGSQTVRLPRGLAPDGEVRFVLDPIGSRMSYTLHPIYAAPGQRIELTVRSRLSTSTLSVWNR